MRIDIGGTVGSGSVSGLSNQLNSAGQLSQSLAQAQCNDREPEIPVQLDRADVNYLSERLAALESRLGPVLRSHPPQEKDNQATCLAQGTVVGARLADLNARITLIIAAVESIADRVEI